MTHTQENQPNPWWEADLGASNAVDSITTARALKAAIASAGVSAELAARATVHARQVLAHRLRERAFAWLARNAATITDFFRIPANRVVELGTRIEL